MSDGAHIVHPTVHTGTFSTQCTAKPLPMLIITATTIESAPEWPPKSSAHLLTVWGALGQMQMAEISSSIRDRTNRPWGGHSGSEVLVTTREGFYCTLWREFTKCLPAMRTNEQSSLYYLLTCHISECRRQAAMITILCL